MVTDWIYNNRSITDINQFPKDTFGFVYKITNLSNNKVYYGQKKLFNVKNKPIAKSTYDRLKKEGDTTLSRKKNKSKSKKGKPVWNHRKEEIKESNWKKYVGSNIELKNDYKKGDSLEREILVLCKNQTDLNFQEARAILCSDCFEQPQDTCYNQWLSVKIRKEFIR